VNERFLKEEEREAGVAPLDNNDDNQFFSVDLFAPVVFSFVSVTDF